MQTLVKKVQVAFKITLSIIVIFGLSLLLQLFHFVNYDIYSFAVDNNEKVYLAKNNVIEVYKDCEKINSIEYPNSRGYEITIVNGDTLLVFTCDGSIYKVNEKEQFIEQEELNGKDFYDYQTTIREFIDDKGNIYKWKSDYLFDTIEKHEKNNIKRVYRLSVIEYIVKIILIISSICLVICVIILLYLNHQCRKFNEKANLIDVINKSLFEKHK